MSLYCLVESHSRKEVSEIESQNPWRYTTNFGLNLAYSYPLLPQVPFLPRQVDLVALTVSQKHCQSQLQNSPQ
jgi:hypothetical protein